MAEEKGEVKEAMSFSKWWSRGFIMNPRTNPKVIIFFLAFFPNFAPGENTEVQILMMGLTFYRCRGNCVWCSQCVFCGIRQRKDFVCACTTDY